MSSMVIRIRKLNSAVLLSNLHSAFKLEDLIPFPCSSQTTTVSWDIRTLYSTVPEDAEHKAENLLVKEVNAMLPIHYFKKFCFPLCSS